MAANPNTAKRNDRIVISFVLAVGLGLLVLIYYTILPWLPGPKPEGVGRLTPAAVAAAGDLILIDARPTPEYQSGHLPGAVSVSVADIRDMDLDMLYSPSKVAALLAQRGVTPERPVVVYADQIADAAYVGWALVLLGHPDVQLLDGGIRAWTEEFNGPLETTETLSPLEPVAVDVWELASTRSWPETFYIGVNTVNSKRSDANLVTVDARSADTRTHTIARPDNLRHASYHIPWTELVNEDGTAFQNRTVLHQLTQQLPAKRQLAVFADDATESALVWWILYEQGYSNTTHLDDTFVVWDLLGYPVQQLDVGGASNATPRIGGGCG